MSTKIHNGYVVTGTGAFEFVETLRSTIKPAIEDLFGRLVARELAEEIDRHRFGLPPLEGGDLEPDLDKFKVRLAAKVKRRINDRVYEARKGSQRSEWDLDFSVVLLPHPRRPYGMLVMVYTERDELRAAFEAIPGVSEYAYWNNTDRPDDVTDEQWDVRRSDWDTAIGHDTPATRGLVWKALATYASLGFGLTDELIVSYLPDSKERALTIAQARNTDMPKAHAAYEAGSNSYMEVAMAEMRELRKVQKKDAKTIEPQLQPITIADFAA